MRSNDVRRRAAENILRAAVALCLGFAAFEVGKTIHNHIPPYPVGTCLGTEKTGPLLQFKITKNNVIGGYSELDATSIFFEAHIKASFQELREDPELIKTNCF